MKSMRVHCCCMQTAMTDVASKAANAVSDTVKGISKATDPKKGQAAPMHGRTAIVTGDERCSYQSVNFFVLYRTPVY